MSFCASEVNQAIVVVTAEAESVSHPVAQRNFRVRVVEVPFRTGANARTQRWGCGATGEPRRCGTCLAQLLRLGSRRAVPLSLHPNACMSLVGDLERTSNAVRIILTKETRSEMARKKKATIIEPVSMSPTYEQIAERAYDIYLARGESPGHDIDDWLRAEAELRAEFGKEAGA